MLFAEDEHPVGDLGPGSEHEPFPVSVRARTLRRELDRFAAGIGQDRVERGAELPGPVPDQEPEAGGTITEVIRRFRICWVVHGPSGVCGHAADVHVTGADLHHEQDVQALEGERAVHMEQIRGEHRRGLGVRELRQVVPVCRFGAGGIFDAVRTRRIVDAPTRSRA